MRPFGAEFLVLPLLLILVGCGDGTFEEASTETDGSGSSDPRRSMLIVAVPPAPIVLDPLDGKRPFQLEAWSYLYPSLLYFEPGIGILPDAKGDLATSWEWDSERTTLRVRLASRTWSDGEVITATDVRESYLLFRGLGLVPRSEDRPTGAQRPSRATLSTGNAPGSQTPTSSSDEAGRSHLLDVEALDAVTVEIRVRPGLPRWAAHEIAAFPVLPPDRRAEAAGEERPGVPVLTVGGPFRPRTRGPDRSTVLIRNPEYEVVPVRIPGVIFEECAGADSRALRVQGGQADLALDVPLHRLQELQISVDQMSVHDAGIESVEMILWNHQPGTGSLELREAVSLAIDRKRLVQLLGATDNRYGGTARGFLLATSERLPLPLHEPAEAAGRIGRIRARGDTIPEIEILYDRANDLRERMMTLIEEDLARAGIAIHPVGLEGDELFRRYLTGDFEAVLLGFRPPLHPESSNLFASWGAWNGGGYANAKVDSLLRRISGESDPNRLVPLIVDAETVLRDDEAVTFLVYRRRIDLLSSRVRGFSGTPWHPLGRLQDITFE